MSNGFRTRSVHAGAEPDPETGARSQPIYQTAAYEFDDADRAAAAYALEESADVYTRVSNPTVRALERRLADLEGGTRAVATASGMAAFDCLTTVLAAEGDNVVASSETYGGTSAYLTSLAPRRGVEPRFVGPLDYEGYAEAIDDDTAYVHVETASNPSLATPDFDRVAEIAHDRAVPLVVDNTFATPALCRPIEHGADVVWESTTKWITGNGTTVGGVLVDGGTFPWDHPDADYPELAGENPVFGFDFSDRFGPEAFAAVARHRAARLVGNTQSPFDAWQTLQGLSTLDLRMRQHCEGAREVAAFLRDDPRVAWVTYPGHEDHRTHEEASRYLDAYGGMISFGPEGGYAAAKALCEAVDLVGFLANVGDARTLVIHPASTTHAQLSDAERREAGIRPESLRLSVGIENPADVIADLDRGLEAAAGVGTGADGGGDR